MFYYTLLERLASAKHYSILGPFVSSEKNEVLWMSPGDALFTSLYSHHFIFSVTYKCSRAPKSRVLHLIDWKSLPVTSTLAYLAQS